MLSLVEDHWLLTGNASKTCEVAVAMPEELTPNTCQKVLQGLDALAKKKLVEKLTRPDHKREKVVCFQPRRSKRCP